MTSIEQSIVHPEVYFVKIGEVTVKVDEENLIELIRSSMRTDVGKKMLDNHIKKLNK